MEHGETPPSGFDAIRRADYTGASGHESEGGAPEGLAAPEPRSAPPPAAPPRVCPKCSALERTSGPFCPHCGASYERRKRRMARRTKLILAALVVLLVLGGGAAAVTVKLGHDDQVARQRREAGNAWLDAANAADARKRQQAADDLAAKRRADKVQRALRHSLIRSVEHSVTKDAQKDVANGLLTGPIISTTCTPVGGGSVDDLTARTGKFECIAVNKITGDGTEKPATGSAPP